MPSGLSIRRSSPEENDSPAPWTTTTRTVGSSDAPIAVFAAVAASIAENGPGVIVTFGQFIGSFYLGLFILWLLLFGVAFLAVGSRVMHLGRYIRDPLVLAYHPRDRRRHRGRRQEGDRGGDERAAGRRT